MLDFLSVFTHARDPDVLVCDVRLCYRLMPVVMKATYTASTHYILPDKLLNDV